MPRRLALPSVVAAAAAVITGWLGMAGGYLWTDYEYANARPFGALAHGDLHTFFSAAPIEGPSLLLRAPFALIPSLWGGGQEAVFRSVAVPGLLAAAVLGVVLWDRRARDWPGTRWRYAFLLLVVANPIALQALGQGHPEELMGAALCVGAVLAALADRRTLAAVLLGLALANKAWAVLAVGPVLLALPSGRLRALVTAGGLAALLTAPYLLDADARAAVTSAGGTDAVFQPWQVWWRLGEHGHVVRGFGGMLKPDYRAAPAWIAPVTHPLIALLVVPASLLWLRLRRGRSADLLLLLAVLLLARCLFDVADNAYYHLPFLLALLGWEAARSARPPILTLAASALVWATVVKAPGFASPDVQSALYLAWALPALVVLAAAAFRPSLVAPPRALATAS